ncbi:extracellular tyrosine-protein kinase PKDCC-like isoform X2 [Penaeus japonicus]|uniref:extracellular tyrosine-protein kinase PKDCC-like isoform X2 n=1 Tax=Penaeus japonicus TaxID=27405 RepID=UPI001C70BD0D|nr:extracellular tyrosine-protein kinase PKDCC-like isoform X2 [Penaeus japonicus]
MDCWMLLVSLGSRMTKLSRLSIYAVIYLCLCLLANVVLVMVFVMSQRWGDSTPAAAPRGDAQGSSRGQDWDPNSGRLLTCKEIYTIRNLTVIGSGWTKTVYRGLYGNSWLALKTVHSSGHDMASCQEETSICYHRCASKIIKETALLRELRHPNVLKVLGECLPSEDYSPGPPAVGVVAVITELGHPVDMIEILQMDFESRLKIAYDVVSILQHLAHSPLGSLLMKDFRRQQFVIVGDTLKLSDVDDIVLGDPKCISDKDCILEAKSVPCDAGTCKGYNSLSNAIQAGQHFMRLLIPYGSPKALENTSSDIVNRLLSGNLYSEEVYAEIHRLVRNYSSGSYLKKAEKDIIKEYVTYPGETISDGDFSCQKIASWGCIQSVSSPAEGAWLCSQIPNCVAFILIDQWSWTGRQIAVFKASYKSIKQNKEHTLYIRRGQG